MSTGRSVVSFRALGTTAALVTDEAAAPAARAVLDCELAAIDAACSRFRPDSELMAVNGAEGRWVDVSPLFVEALEVALRAARLTAGAVDPTIGASLRVLGYDRDFAQVPADGPPLRVTIRPVPGWRLVAVDAEGGRVRVPAGAELDLGATAKALCADRAARRAAETTGTGVLVSLGGDVSVAGPAPDLGWVVRVGDDHAAPLDGPGQTVSIMAGGLATSGTAVRHWDRGGAHLHHVIDPTTGGSAETCWRTVSVAAGTCVDANIASTAAIVLGPAAPAWLEARGLPARLVGLDGRIRAIGAWPVDGPGRADEEEVAACSQR